MVAIMTIAMLMSSLNVKGSMTAYLKKRINGGMLIGARKSVKYEGEKDRMHKIHKMN